MKAVIMQQVGDPNVLSLLEVPEPEIVSATQISVRLHGAGVNLVDTKLRSKGLFYSAQPPAILGCDGAGEVTAVGKAVRRFNIGDEVWFCHGGLGREQGNYAEFTVLEETEAEHKPASQDYAHAGAAPLVLITAWEALFDRGRLQPGQTVLIHAGAGGVGHVAVQLARIKEARVIATVSSPEKAEFVKYLGADYTINYRDQDLVSAVNEITEGRGVDLAFDTVGPEVFRQTIPTLAHYGTLVTILDPGLDLDLKEARNRNLSIAFTLMLTPMLAGLRTAREHHGEILRVCGAWMDEGQLDIEVSRQYALADAAAAHRDVESGHTRGKLVLIP